MSANSTAPAPSPSACLRQIDLGRAHRDEHRLLRLKAVPDEPGHSLDKLTLARVEERLVAKAAAVGMSVGKRGSMDAA